MSPRIFILLVALALTSSAAHAQAAAYITYSPASFPFTAANSLRDDNGILNGGSAGITVDHIHEGRFLTAVDLRCTFNTKTHIRAESAALDYRISFVPARIWLRPFLQLGVGFVHVHDPNNPVYLTTPTVTNATLDLGLGLDLRITQRIDLRLLELNGSAPFRSGTTASPGVGASILSTGVIYHFSSTP